MLSGLVLGGYEGENLFHAFLLLLVAAGNPGQIFLGLQLCHFHLSASVSCGFLPVCLCVPKPPSPFKDTSLLGLGITLVPV